MDADSTGARVLRYLEQHGLKQEGDHWRCNSPLRPGSNSHGFSIRIDPDGEHGAFKDFVTEESGSLYDLAHLLGVETSRKEVPNTKRVYQGLADYAKAHGLTAQLLMDAGWSEATKDNRPALAFKTNTGIRYRFLDGEKPVYKSPQGYKSCWYGLERATALAEALELPLVLCNGEISTVAAQYYYVPAAAITGSSEKALPKDLLSELQEHWQKAIVIALDCDEKGVKAARKLAQQLAETGYEVRAVDLGLGLAGDLADFCQLHPESTGARLLELPDLRAPETVIEQTISYIEGQINKTDLGNSRRLVQLHGNNLRYCHIWGKWLVWDGQRWAIDDTAQVIRWAKETVASIYKEASVAIDDKERIALAQHAIRSEASAKIAAMISLAESEPGIPIRPDELDTDHWILNVANGTIDLKTGELQPHDKVALITKLIPVEYDPDALAPLWESFLNRVMDNNQNLISFLQRVIGYCLTGDTSEQCLVFMWGTGANGKSTFIETLRTLLAEYSQQTPTETLMRKDQQTINNDIARLRGTRLVSAVETEENQRLAEVLVKQLTGGDTITARFLRQEFFEFRPTFKIFLAGNHKPAIRGTDHGIWRRIRLVPFTVTIPEQERDPNLSKKLQAELPGILAWAVRGCLLWQEMGLDTPAEVVNATEGYRSEMDTLHLFLEECCVNHPAAKVTAKALYSQYTSWCEENGENPMSQKKLGSKLTERGYTRTRTMTGFRWDGIGLLAVQGEQEAE